MSKVLFNRINASKMKCFCKLSVDFLANEKIEKKDEDNDEKD